MNLETERLNLIGHKHSGGYDFVVYNKADPSYSIGEVNLFVDEKIGEIWVAIKEPYRGLDFGPEAVKAVSEYA